jgi:hypothetical protein
MNKMIVSIVGIASPRAFCYLTLRISRGGRAPTSSIGYERPARRRLHALVGEPRDFLPTQEVPMEVGDELGTIVWTNPANKVARKTVSVHLIPETGH